LWSSMSFLFCLFPHFTTRESAVMRNLSFFFLEKVPLFFCPFSPQWFFPPKPSSAPRLFFPHTLHTGPEGLLWCLGFFSPLAQTLDDFRFSSPPAPPSPSGPDAVEVFFTTCSASSVFFPIPHLHSFAYLPRRSHQFWTVTFPIKRGPPSLFFPTCSSPRCSFPHVAHVPPSSQALDADSRAPFPQAYSFP